MKVAFYGNFNYPKFEGVMGIVDTLKNYLEKKGVEIVYNTRNADIIHGFSGGFILSKTLKEIKEKHNIPCIYSLFSPGRSDPVKHLISRIQQHRIDPTDDFKPLQRMVLSTVSISLPLKMRAANFKHLDVVVVPSKVLQKDFFDNTRVIHVGIDTKRFRPIKSAQNKGKNINVSYIGHNDLNKGIPEILEVSNRLKKGLNYSFFFSNRSRFFDNYVKRKNKDIVIQGFQKDLVKTYNSADIVLYPLRMPLSSVANPLVLLEAMACERAIVTTDMPHIKEIVKSTAMLVSPYSSDELGEAVEKLKDPKLRTKLGKRARKRIVDSYNQEIMCKKYLKLYEEFV